MSPPARGSLPFLHMIHMFHSKPVRAPRTSLRPPDSPSRVAVSRGHHELDLVVRRLLGGPPSGVGVPRVIEEPSLHDTGYFHSAEMSSRLRRIRGAGEYSSIVDTVVDVARVRSHISVPGRTVRRPAAGYDGQEGRTSKIFRRDLPKGLIASLGNGTLPTWGTNNWR